MAQVVAEERSECQIWDDSGLVSESLHRGETLHIMLLSYTESCLVGRRILQSDGDVVLGSMCCRMI